MSLYSLATDLFEDIDKVRAAAPDPTISAKTQPRLLDGEPGDRLCIKVNSEVQLPQLVAWQQNGKTEQTPTLELLEGCLYDIHEIRCGGRSTRVAEAKRSRNEGQSCYIDDSDRTSSPCSETSSTEGDLVDQDNDGEGGTGILCPETDAGVSIDAKGGDTKAAIHSFVRVPLAELWSSSGGKKTGAGSTMTTHTSTIVHESGAIDGSRGHVFPRLETDGKDAATDQCGCGAEQSYCMGTDAAATESYAEFEREITEWSTSVGVGGSQRIRTDMATHFSEKYLCRKLDAMPSSTVVYQLRREIIRRIDLLATGKDQPVDGVEKQLTTSGSHNGHKDLVVDYDEDLSTMGHTPDGDDPPLPVNEREAPTILASRVAPYRGPVANRVRVERVDVDPTRSEGRSVQAGPGFPDMKGVGPASNSSVNELSGVPAPFVGEQYTTAKRLAVVGLGAGGRIAGEAPPCLRRVAQQFPPVRVDKGVLSSSNSAVRPRARAVRFLLGVDDSESRPCSAEVVNGSQAWAETANLEAVNQGDIECFWTCVVCGKTNEKGGVSCTICGRRQQRRGCVTKARLGVRAEEQDPAVVRRVPSIPKQRREHRQESAHLESRGDSIRSDRKAGKRLDDGSGIGGVRDTARKLCGPYDASSFGKMRKETEPAVKARLGLTGEIKSLLSAIRRNG